MEVHRNWWTFSWKLQTVGRYLQDLLENCARSVWSEVWSGLIAFRRPLTSIELQSVVRMSILHSITILRGWTLCGKGLTTPPGSKTPADLRPIPTPRSERAEEGWPTPCVTLVYVTSFGWFMAFNVISGHLRWSRVPERMMTLWSRFSSSRNGSGNRVQVKDNFTSRPAFSTEFRGGSCCESRIGRGAQICKVLPGCIPAPSKTPANVHVTIKLR